MRKVHTGVPQGSILGPLLFLAYINDLSSCLTYSQCQLFADDTVLITKHANRNVSYANLQADISKINEWCRVNQLTINAKKTEYIEFTNKRNQPANDIITLNLGDHVLIRAAEYKYLGTVLDQHLTGIPQYNKVMKSINSKIANFAKLRYLINTETALTIYKTTILPILDYNDFMYYLLPDNKLKKIETSQNRSLRCVYNYHPMHVQEMRTMAKLPRLFDRRKLHLLGLMYKRSSMTEYLDNRRLRTRQFDKIVLITPDFRLTRTTKCPIILGSRLWNELPKGIQDAGTYPQFKHKVKEHFNMV